ncbi:unnamed protein product, partial [Vitis vinifera]
MVEIGRGNPTRPRERCGSSIRGPYFSGGSGTGTGLSWSVSPSRASSSPCILLASQKRMPRSRPSFRGTRGGEFL